jgi:hypothetical protein
MQKKKAIHSNAEVAVKALHSIAEEAGPAQ